MTDKLMYNYIPNEHELVNYNFWLKSLDAQLD